MRSNFLILLGGLLILASCSKNETNGPKTSRVSIGAVKVGSGFADFAVVHHGELGLKLTDAIQGRSTQAIRRSSLSSTAQSTSATSAWQQVLGGNGTLTYASTTPGITAITDNVNLANLAGYSRTIANDTYNISLSTQAATAVADSFIRFSASNPNFVVSQNGPINFAAATNDGVITVASNQIKAGTQPQFTTTIGGQTFKFGSTSANTGYYYLYVTNNTAGTISITSTSGKALTKSFTVLASNQYNLIVNQSSNLGPLIITFGPFTLQPIVLLGGGSQSPVSTFAGTPNVHGSADGVGTAAQFNYPAAAAFDAAGNLFVADHDNNEIRKITPSGVVSTFAGALAMGASDGTGTAARFNGPTGLAFDKAGNLFVADEYNHEIRKITPAGVVSTFAGSGGPGAANGVGRAAQFNRPIKIAFDTLTGTLFVADSRNNEIRKIKPDGTVSSYAGKSSLSPGFVNGDTSLATFNEPKGIVINSLIGGLYLYVSDYNNNQIRQIIENQFGTVNVFHYAGSTSVTAGFANSGGSAGNGGLFNGPLGGTFGFYPGAGSPTPILFVTDVHNNAIRFDVNAWQGGVIPNFQTLTGNGTPGYQDGTLAQALFNGPQDVAYNPRDSSLYVCDANNFVIRKISLK